MNFISNANGHYFNLDVKTKSFDLISKDLEHCKVHDSYDEMLKVVSEDENIEVNHDLPTKCLKIISNINSNFKAKNQ